MTAVAIVASRPMRQRFTITWLELEAIEPYRDELDRHVAALVAAYNHPANAKLLGHTAPLAAEDVIDHYERLWQNGDRPFLILRDGELVGDADVRGIADGRGEFAFLIAAPSAQGKGTGTKIAIMLHHFAFSHLAIEHVYASVLPENVASLRVFEKLGYLRDTSELARAFGDPGDVTLSLSHARFQQRHSDRLGEIAVHPRDEK